MTVGRRSLGASARTGAHGTLGRVRRVQSGHSDDAAVVADLVRLDPRRPWPGVPRDPAVRQRGLDAMVGPGWTDADPPPNAAPSVVLAPAALTVADDPGAVLALLLDVVPVGGHVVTEEPGSGSTAELEPLVVDGERAGLVSVVDSHDADTPVLDLAVMWFTGEPGAVADVRVDRARVVPMSAAEHDAIAAVNGFELVARWSDWAGQPAGDGWRISIHRRVT